MLMILLRSIHVVLGALWVGIAVFVAFFLMPSLKEIGPDANKVMVALQKRGMVTFVPAIAILTLLSGIGLLWKVSSGFGAEYMGSHMGMALSTGALAAIVGWTIGMTVVAPSMYKAATMSQALPTITAEAERNAQLRHHHAAPRSRRRGWPVDRDSPPGGGPLHGGGAIRIGVRLDSAAD